MSDTFITEGEGFKVSWMTGVKVLKPVEYRITTEVLPRRWWQRRPREQYWVTSDFGRMGPFETWGEVFSTKRLLSVVQ